MGCSIWLKIAVKEKLNVLDLCCGTGFPALEVAERLGFNSKIYGIDLFTEALSRTRYKAKVYGIQNAKFVIGNAIFLPFLKNSFDLIISNRGRKNNNGMWQSLQKGWIFNFYSKSPRDNG